MGGTLALSFFEWRKLRRVCRVYSHHMLWMEPWLTVLHTVLLIEWKKQHETTHDRPSEGKNNVGFKRTKQTCYAKGLLDQTCVFCGWNFQTCMAHTNMVKKTKVTGPLISTSAQDWLWNKPGCDVLMVGKWEGHVPKYIKIWNMFGFAWGAQEVKMIPYGFPSGFPIGTVRQMLEQIQGMGSSLHGYWMMCIPCILSGSYLSSMGVIHSWL